MKKILFVLSLFLVLTGSVTAQLKIDGHVKNIDGDPLPGVNVTIKGTKTGVVTNLDGYYQISNVPADGILVFSFLGMLTEEIPVGEKTSIDLTMVDDIQNLDEVVVVGYGAVKRANLTGAVVDIKADELEDIPVGNLASALDGKLAGVKISSSTGKPGETPILSIRTESSFGRVTEDVLYVIDGVISNATEFNLLDASEVESISVLKDAAAAVYGARAAGGVVLVKTKRGSVGASKIQYSGSFGIAKATKIPEMLDGPTLARMYNEVLNIDTLYSARPPSEFNYYTEDEIDHFNNVSYNWLDELLKPATTQKHTLNLSGGNERVKYFAGGSYYNETGMFDYLNYSRYNIRTNIESKITKNLTATLGINYSYSEKISPNYSGESQGGVLRETYKQALTAAPWIPLTVDGLPVGNNLATNPVALLESGSYKNSTKSNNGIRLALQYDIPVIKGLTYNFQFSHGENHDKGKEFAQDYIQYMFNTTGEHSHIIITDEPYNKIEVVGNEEGLYNSSSYSKNYQLNTSLNYSKELGLHNIAGLLVYEQSESKSNSVTSKKEAAAIIPGYDQNWAFNNANWESSSSADESGRLGLIGRLNYGYARKYLFEGTFRYEASQKFHPDNRWGFFPAISGAWVISEESFFRNNIRFLNFMKLRGSAGIVGNDNLRSSFFWTPTFEAKDIYGPIFGNSITSGIEGKNGLYYAPSIHWQTTRSYDVGLDSRLMNNQINFAIDYYYRHTYDVFNQRNNIPTTVGLNIEKPPEENYGEADARGIEIELGYNKSINKIKFNIDGNFSWDKKREVKLFQNPAVEGSWRDDRRNDPSNQPGYVALGIMRTQEQLNDWMERYPDYTINGRPLELGMIYYKDVCGEEYTDSTTGKIAYLPPDGKITGDDIRIIAKYTSPPFHYGISLGISYKGFSISGTFTGIFGHKVFISKDEQVTPDPDKKELNNVFGFWADYWTPENPDAKYPRPYAYGLEEQNTTFWMRNGHTLRLKNLNVSYTMPKEISTKIRIPELRLYFTSQNLWTIINPFDHKDPGISRGYDYPLMRTYNLGINITI